MQQDTYEYKTIEKTYKTKSLLMEELNLLGKQGWNIFHIKEHKPKITGGEFLCEALLKRKTTQNKQILND